VVGTITLRRWAAQVSAGRVSLQWQRGDTHDAPTGHLAVVEIDPFGDAAAIRTGAGEMEPAIQPAPQRQRTRDPLVGGVVLIIIGAALLVAQFSPDLGRYVVLVIGLGLLALFVINRAYGALVGGSIVTGVGVGIVLASTYTGDQAGAAMLLSIGAGFLLIWILSYALGMKERHFWPLVPAAILGSIGAALLIGEQAIDWIAYWPVVLIALGAMLVLVAYLRREAATPDE